MGTSRSIRPVPYLVALTVLAAAYAASARLGLSIPGIAEQVSLVWPPTGIALASLLLLGRDLWPGVAVGAFIANYFASEPITAAVGIAIGNTLEALVGVWLLERAGFRPSLARVRDVLALLVLAALGSTLVSATIGVTSLCLGGVHPWTSFGRLWPVWWIGDAMGDAVMAPVLLVWASIPRPGWPPIRRAEGAGLLMAVVGVGLSVFTGRGGGIYPLHYTIFPLVIWAAFRLGQQGTTVVTLVSLMLAIAGTVAGRGPFVQGTTHEGLILLQLFMAMVAVTGLLLAAAIAERNAAEAQRERDYARLELGEARLRLALEAGRMGVWDWDLVSGHIEWSPNLEPMHGLAPGTFDGTIAGFRALVHPEDRQRVDEAIRRAIEQGHDYQVEFRNVWPDGSVHWMSGRGTVQHDERGAPTHMIGVGMDVTERRQLEDALRERAEQLTDADRRKDEFLAMLAHELRNPLAAISSAAALLRLGAGAEMADRAGAIVDRQVRHLARLVDDLLDASRITSGKITLRSEPVDLAAAVRAAVETARPLIEGQRHTLEVSLPEEPLWLDGDRARLTQVFTNLLDNAAKYTPRGGAVSVRVGRAGDAAVVEVRDSGVGMAPETLAHAFDLFSQGARGLDRAQSGLGIGLTVVRRLVELHGGRVVGTSDGPDRGSRFTVHLPARPAGWTPARAAAGAPLDGTAVRARRVLVVDDNVDMVASTAALLSHDGHHVRTATSGAEAITTASAFAPDVVLLDIGLPGMDGYEVAKRLRAAPNGRTVRLIAVSGYGRDEDRRQSLDSGFDAHLVKPVDLDVLRQAVSGAGAPAG